MNLRNKNNPQNNEPSPSLSFWVFEFEENNTLFYYDYIIKWKMGDFQKSFWSSKIKCVKMMELWVFDLL